MLLFFLKKKRGDFNPILMINEHPPAVGCLYPRPLSGRPVSIAVGGGGVGGGGCVGAE